MIFNSIARQQNVKRDKSCIFSNNHKKKLRGTKILNSKSEIIVTDQDHSFWILLKFPSHRIFLRKYYLHGTSNVYS